MRSSSSVNDHSILSIKDKETVFETRRVVIREIVEDLNISYRSTQHILINFLGRKRVSTRLVNFCKIVVE